LIHFDHFAVAGLTLVEASEYVQHALGVPLQTGGRHAHFGTYNQLLGLGDFYIEAIAIDPTAPAPDYPRWFDLNNFAGNPRITNWICATADLDALLRECPFEVGTPLALQRDHLRWRFTNPQSGNLPMDGACPALIDWGDTPHPAKSLVDQVCRLQRFVVQHPEASTLEAFFAPRMDCPWLVFEQGSAVAFEAEIDTPHGRRVLR